MGTTGTAQPLRPSTRYPSQVPVHESRLETGVGSGRRHTRGADPPGGRPSRRRPAGPRVRRVRGERTRVPLGFGPRAAGDPARHGTRLPRRRGPVRPGRSRTGAQGGARNSGGDLVCVVAARAEPRRRGELQRRRAAGSHHRPGGSPVSAFRGRVRHELGGSRAIRHDPERPFRDQLRRYRLRDPRPGDVERRDGQRLACGGRGTLLRPGSRRLLLDGTGRRTRLFPLEPPASDGRNRYVDRHVLERLRPGTGPGEVALRRLRGDRGRAAHRRATGRNLGVPDLGRVVITRLVPAWPAARNIRLVPAWEAA